MRRIRVLVVFGTRPEAIKMGPLVTELLARPNDFDVCVCVTGQHREMLKQVLEVFGIQPDHDLEIMRPSQTLAQVTTAVLQKFPGVLSEFRPDIVLVHGDTTTAFAASLGAFYEGVAVGHVEAGLRTWDMNAPFPEEFNRQAIDLVSELFFAPTEQSKQNLVAEGKPESRVFVTGNTGIDALRTTVREDFANDATDWAAGSRLVLVTAHRRENLGSPMRGIFRALRRVVEENDDVKVLYPVHMNPAVRAAAAAELAGIDRIRLVDPMDAVEFHNVLARSYLVLTDSGGIQEEAPSLGKPVLVARDTTERPEGVAAGTLRLVGTDEDEVYSSLTQLLNDSETYEEMARATNPYGDGFASRRIADTLTDKYGANRRTVEHSG